MRKSTGLEIVLVVWVLAIGVLAVSHHDLRAKVKAMRELQEQQTRLMLSIGNHLNSHIEICNHNTKAMEADFMRIRFLKQQGGVVFPIEDARTNAYSGIIEAGVVKQRFVGGVLVNGGVE